MREQRKRTRIARKGAALAVSFVLAIGCLPATALAETQTINEDVKTTVVAPVRDQGVIVFTDVVVNGNVSVSGDLVDGVRADSSPNCADPSVKVSGDVTVDGYTHFGGVNVNAPYEKGSSSVDVGGSVQVKTTDKDTNNAVGAYVKSSRGGKASLTVGGDIATDGTTDQSYGLKVTADGAGGPAVVVVGGTIQSGSTGVHLENSDMSATANASDLLDLTVWKVEAGEGRPLFSTENVKDEDKGLAAAVNYIVKVADSLEGKLGYNDDGLATKKGDGYEYVTARQDQKVYLKGLNGWYVKGVSGEGYGKDDKGFYYMVPAGGGVLLAADMDNHYDITYDLGGGTWDGQTGSVVKSTEFGALITLPAPVREGYDFLYWEGSRYEAGASYKVEGAHAFKAVWKENEAAPEPAPAEEKAAETKAATATASTASSSSGSSMPQTGDTAPVIPAIATLLLAAAAIGASRAKLQPIREGKHARR